MSVYEPWFNRNMQKCNQCYSQSSSSERKYYFSRNIPHPRMVCHIPGLNNALICVVRNSISREHPSTGNTVVLEQEAHQEHVVTGSAKSNTSANCYLPKLEGFIQRELGTSQLVTGHADVPKRIKTSPTSSEKLLKKEFQAFVQPADREGIHVTPLTQPSSPFNNSHYSPRTQNRNSDPSYLDEKIRVLEKLSKILQTDSLTEIKKWLARASKEEKDFMSSLIDSDLSDKGMLNSKEDKAENMNSLSLPQLPSPLQRGPEGKINQSRSSSKQSVASQNMKQGKIGLSDFFSSQSPLLYTQSGQANNIGTPKKHHYYLFVPLLKHTEATKICPRKGKECLCPQCQEQVQLTRTQFPGENCN